MFGVLSSSPEVDVLMSSLSEPYLTPMVSIGGKHLVTYVHVLYSHY